MLNTFLIALLVSSSIPSTATEIPPYEVACRADDPAFKKIGRKARIKMLRGQAFQPLFDRPNDCPKEVECGWRLPVRLNGGDIVHAGRRQAGYVCVAVDQEMKILGWVPAKNLTFLKK